MSIQSLANKMALKAYNSPQFQESWAVHMQAFRPILEPAFQEDYPSRIHLCALLNHLSSRNLSSALEKIKILQKACATEADHTAFSYFAGLYCELSGDQESAIELYCTANRFGHRFYLPYLKVAKYFLDCRDYDHAEVNYRAGIDCFTATGLEEKDKLILGSAYTNLASCLTMMHRYEEAEAALVTSRNLYPNAQGRAAVEAVLYAIQGDATQAEACLSVLQTHAPAAYAGVKESVDNILARTDPLFYPVPLDEKSITAFWAWFHSYEDTLLAKLNREEYEEALSPVAGKLLETFPFLEETPYVALGENEQGFVLELADMYAVAVMEAYHRLLDLCPQDILSRWQFAVIH